MNLEAGQRQEQNSGGRKVVETEADAKLLNKNNSDNVIMAYKLVVPFTRALSSKGTSVKTWFFLLDFGFRFTISCVKHSSVLLFHKLPGFCPALASALGEQMM